MKCCKSLEISTGNIAVCLGSFVVTSVLNVHANQLYVLEDL